MSEHPQPGLHPDPDTLNAFIEGVLPEHERLACLTHFADCAACREVVYLAQEPEAPSPDPVVEKAAWWKGLFCRPGRIRPSYIAEYAYGFAAIYAA